MKEVVSKAGCVELKRIGVIVNFPKDATLYNILIHKYTITVQHDLAL